MVSSASPSLPTTLFLSLSISSALEGLDGVLGLAQSAHHLVFVSLDFLGPGGTGWCPRPRPVCPPPCFCLSRFPRPWRDWMVSSASPSLPTTLFLSLSIS